MDRRKFVKFTGVAAAAGVTGCLGGGDNGEDEENGDDEDNGDNGGDNGDNGGSESTVGQDGNYTDMTGEDEVEVDVGAGEEGYKFDPADVSIDPGTTVRWVWTGEGSQHNVIESDGEEPLSDPSFESELTAEEGFEFTHTFEESGTYDYVCDVHLAQDMIGSVEVVEGEGGDGGMDGGNETDTGNETDGNESE
ncbi:MAG: halocyanin domain-containing protein [Halobacteriales archaeon]